MPRKKRSRPARVRLTADDYYYYLACPGAFRERAKSVPSCVWDPRHKCWVYPKRPSVRRQLLTEFGPELYEELVRAQADIEQELEEAKADTESMSDEYNELDYQSGKWQDRAEAAESDLRSARRAVERERERADTLASQVARLQANNNGLAQELGVVRADYERLRQELTQTAAKLRSAESERRELRLRLDGPWSFGGTTTSLTAGHPPHRVCGACGGMLTRDGDCHACAR
jgi:hypothetical protein